MIVGFVVLEGGILLCHSPVQLKGLTMDKKKFCKELSLLWKNSNYLVIRIINKKKKAIYFIASSLLPFFMSSKVKNINISPEIIQVEDIEYCSAIKPLKINPAPAPRL